MSTSPIKWNTLYYYYYHQNAHNDGAICYVYIYFMKSDAGPIIEIYIFVFSFRSSNARTHSIVSSVVRLVALLIPPQPTPSSVHSPWTASPAHFDSQLCSALRLCV